MNYKFYTLGTALSLIASTQALDFQTDPTCAKLKTAIEQAQSVEKVQETWNGVTASLSKENSAHLAQQATIYAQEQQQALEQIVTALGDKNYDTSKLKWGGLKIFAGSYCLLGTIVYFLAKQKIYNPTSNIFLGSGTVIAIPDISFFLVLPKSFKNFIKIAKKKYRNDYLFPPLALLRLPLAAWFLYAGAQGIKQGLHYKQTLETKIKNLTATIEFLQPLTNGTITQ